MKLIRSISGIRGIIGKNLSPAIAAQYAKSFSLIQPELKPFIIARDTRNQGYEISQEIKNTIIKTGRDIYDIDIAATPVIQHLVKKLNAAGGIMITASHNPEDWNGLKFIDSDGCFIGKEKNSILFKNVDKKLFPEESLKKGNIYDKRKFINSFMEDLMNLKCIDIERIKSKKFNVAVDAINGANYQLLPTVLRKLNCKVFELYCNDSGKFDRNPEPLPENLKDLSKQVIKYNADVGFACDPDGDRLSIVDDKGIAIGEESTLVLCADDYYKETKSKLPLVTNLSSTMCLDYIAKKNNVDIFRSAVGEANVIELMKEKKSMIGGEGNGGVILKDLHLGRDSLVAAIMILNKLSKSSEKISSIYSAIPKYHMIKSKISIPDIDLNFLYKYLKDTYHEAIYDERDGLKLIWDTKWAHIRNSNTEPIIRIIGESESLDKTSSLISNIKENINKFIDEN